MVLPLYKVGLIEDQMAQFCGGHHPLDHQLLQRPAHPAHRLQPGGGPHHHLGAQGVIVGRHLVAAEQGGVHPHPGPAGEMKKFHPSRAGPKALPGVLRVDAALHGTAGQEQAHRRGTGEGQGYDFLHLYETKGCKLQMGGSDQWGNITTGAELIRRTNGGEVFALTCPLITKADGGKFGKTESGNIWLDPRYTSPYKFYQFWLNVSDSDAERYIKIFTSIEKEEIEALIAEHQAAPHLRILQKRLAKEVTVMVHSEDDYNAAVDASNILFGNATSEALRKLDEDTLLAVFEGVPQFEISRDALTGGVKAVDLFVDNAAVFASKGEMRKLVQGGGVSLNKEKLAAFDQVITAADLLDEKYLLVQRGKKNYYLLIAK